MKEFYKGSIDFEPLTVKYRGALVTQYDTAVLPADDGPDTSTSWAPAHTEGDKTGVLVDCTVLPPDAFYRAWVKVGTSIFPVTESIYVRTD